MQEKSCEVAWAAGLFEGEGHIGFSHKGEWRGVRLSLGMCDEDVVRRFQEVVQCGTVHSVPRRGDWKPFWNWRIGAAEDCVRVLSLFADYFGERRGARAREALLVCETAIGEKKVRPCVICGTPFLPIRGAKRLRVTCSARCARRHYYWTKEKPRRDALPKKPRGGTSLSPETRAKIAAAQTRAWQRRKGG